MKPLRVRLFDEAAPICLRMSKPSSRAHSPATRFPLTIIDAGYTLGHPVIHSTEHINETEISMKSKNVIKKKVCGALGTTFW